MRYVVAAVVLLLLSGCRPDARVNPPSLSQAIPGIPVPPASQILGRSGSEDALQISFRSDWDQARMLDYYRGIFSREPWDLVSDETDASGAAVLYAERDGPPLWVRIQKMVGGPGVSVVISGAVIKPSALPADSSPVDSSL